MNNYALLLDRDGVINVDHGYVHSPDNFEFIDGIFDVARQARASGYRLVVITNQAGIARGYYSEEQFHQLTKWMCARFEEEGAPIDKVYFSPFHPTEGVGNYKKDDISRKPGPGMIIRASAELGLDLINSVLIGDKISDLQAGIAGGVGCNILLSLEPKDPELQRCHRIEKLRDALPFLNSPSQKAGMQ
jgi:D-glycero-D-manno-heptose 1,7-bisphosphate phosphatase